MFLPNCLSHFLPLALFPFTIKAQLQNPRLETKEGDSDIELLAYMTSYEWSTQKFIVGLMLREHFGSKESWNGL